MKCPDCGHTGHLDMCSVSLEWARICHCPSSMEQHIAHVAVWSSKPPHTHMLPIAVETRVNGWSLGDYLFNKVGGFRGT